MRKLTRDQKETMTLDNVNSSCACVAYCVGGSFMKEYYQGIQRDNAHAGDPGPFRIETDI